MRPTWLLACLTLVGCRQIFGLEQPTRGDGSLDDALVDIDAPDAGPCMAASSTCAGTNTLRTCDGPGAIPTDTACAWGCNTTVLPRCNQLAPSGGVLMPADLAPTAGITDVVIDNGTTINTDTGEITGVRVAGMGLFSGIKFEPRTVGGVFTFQSLTVSASLVAIGSRPLVIVALDGVTISTGGALDLRGTCTTNVGGPGGGTGGQSGADAAPGGGQGGVTNEMGGGGGGYGNAGARGGNGGAGSGPPGGPPYGNAAITPLVGGAGGGGGGDAVGGGLGGGGGGAVQIATNGDVVVNQGGAINAGGCGGKSTTANDSGGGGGAGGAILIEAVAIAIHGTLAVNGGGGGAAEGGNPGGNGASSRLQAVGGNGAEGGGGDGAAGSDLTADDGLDGGANAGGGGGGLGRIRLNTRSSAVIVGVSGVMSPNFGDGGTTATQGTAAVQ